MNGHWIKGTNATNAALIICSGNAALGESIQKKMLTFISSSFYTCFLYVFCSICTLISGMLTVLQNDFHRPMELHSVWLTASISCPQNIFICVCLCGITCTDRSSSNVLQNQSFSSHSSLEWMNTKYSCCAKR